MSEDLVVVGASFAGLACARAAALAGLRVTVLEKKVRPGEKLHTTGLIVKDAVDSVPWLRDVPPALVRRIEGVRLHAPSLRFIDLHAPGYWFWATDAPQLLDWMADAARAAGARVRTASTFTSAARDGGGWRIPLADGELLARYVVGADGPHSRVAKALGLSRNGQFLYGVEHEYEDGVIAPDLLHCFIDRGIAPGYIGWAFAGVRSVQVGLARRLRGSGRVDLAPLLAKMAPRVQPHGEPLSVRAGMIPCGGVLPRVGCAGALLVGDAAGMVSPLTAGGIHTALRHGEQVAHAVVQHLRDGAPDPAGWLPARYPSFRAKRVLRWLFDRFQNDWMFDLLLATPPMRRAAELVYFHRKGGGGATATGEP